ncbi:DNA translocase FtsK [Ferviditalea candida]|uniref:DNA translocase FtsK n=1 Tax=Ferviditalea candida TaxID=3108399 RepID=A0ABU5ZJH9_9BACL|nr:DNA translocase FtsK [Paenibacillaceae bacterium T2]
MAKKRNKKKRNDSILKYEMYGILLIVFSVISLAGKGQLPGLGSVGRSLSYISLFMAGHLYFVIPFAVIYIGLHVMVKRKWPRKWSSRMTGLLLLTFAFALLQQFQLIEQQYPNHAPGYSSILQEPYANLKDYLSSKRTDLDAVHYKEGLGGGFAGALIFMLLYFFFGNIGAKLFMYAFFAIGFIYVTGFSYVELGGKFRDTMNRLFLKLKERLQEIAMLLKRKNRAQKHRRKLGQARLSSLPLEEDIHEETLRPNRKKRSAGKNKSLLMQLLQSDEKNDAPMQEGRFVEEDGDKPLFIEQTPEPSETDGAVVPDQDEKIPYFRDFLDHTEQLDEAFPIEQVNESEQQVETVESPLPETVPKEQPAEEDLPDQELAFSGSPEGEKPPVPYQLPPFYLLKKPLNAGKGAEHLDYKANARKLEATLESFGVRAKVLEIVRGPAVTRYEIQPDIGVKVSRIVGLADDIALALAAKDLRMEAPIPGKSAIGIEVPNMEIAMVTMREVMESAAFHESVSKLSICLGRDISGQPIVGNLARMPHLLVAGATGSGKSVCINGIISSILFKAKPDEVKFLMIDPKMVELTVYNGIPHLLAPVVTDPRRASLALKKVVSEMEKRYELFSKSGTRNVEGYNLLVTEKGEEPLPYIVVIVDELADLMMVAAGDVEDAICRLAQMARAAGIHLIIATQRPSVDVITGLIKANIPSRIAFGVSSQVDSRTILDMAGAEKLLGRGDMLYLPVGESKPIRVQGAFVSDQEVEAIVDFVSSQGKAEYREELVPEVEEQQDKEEASLDELYLQAVQIVVEAKQASVSLLQRRLRIGYTRAARLIDSMEANGIVGSYEGSKPREVLLTPEQFHQNRISS